MQYKLWSREQKQAFAKKFSVKEREAYRKGKRNGWLARHHDKSGKYDKKKSSFMTHKYTDKELNSLFDDLDKVKLY